MLKFIVTEKEQSYVLSVQNHAFAIFDKAQKYNDCPYRHTVLLANSC